MRLVVGQKNILFKRFDRTAVADETFRSMTLVFHDANDRNFYSLLSQNISRSIDLCCRAINDEYARQRPFRMAEPTFENFSQSCNVIISDSANSEFAIRILDRLSAVHNGHYCNGFGSSRVSDVERFDASATSCGD